VLADARRDPRLRGNGALRDLGVVAYVGAPLITRDGHALGALCAVDVRPRDWTADEVATLVDLAGSVLSEIELRTRRAPAR
jgi:GAF domain-containing protein